MTHLIRKRRFLRVPPSSCLEGEEDEAAAVEVREEGGSSR